MIPRMERPPVAKNVPAATPNFLRLVWISPRTEKARKKEQIARVEMKKDPLSTDGSTKRYLWNTNISPTIRKSVAARLVLQLVVIDLLADIQGQTAKRIITQNIETVSTAQTYGIIALWIH